MTKRLLKHISLLGLSGFLVLLPMTVSAYEMMMGTASFYGAGEPLNDNTAMNIPFDARLMECASWEYPLGSVLEVTSTRTGKKVIVRCTDRGPARRLNRLIDLTAYAYSQIDDPRSGLTPVSVRRIK